MAQHSRRIQRHTLRNSTHIYILTHKHTLNRICLFFSLSDTHASTRTHVLSRTQIKVKPSDCQCSAASGWQQPQFIQCLHYSTFYSLHTHTSPADLQPDKMADIFTHLNRPAVRRVQLVWRSPRNKKGIFHDAPRLLIELQLCKMNCKVLEC